MNIHIENRQKAVKLDPRRIRRVVHKLKKILNCPDQEISLLFVDDEQIRQINRQYLNRDHPTNVISFPLREGDYGDINPQVLGDIVISAERAFQDAAAGDLSLNDEIDFLVIHGLLHLLGYNHEGGNKKESIKMRDKENEVFFMLNGYELERL
ncbi:MAG: rRNA maturation RNase YbeY [Deltaproteobacteria bacterium HGW-Deltaproteobacteria-9]|nr:MAG: rRNA maturation RNase YbeY [Deltaproteobacteria bacterium HGW-Deltaproteobacteria-9]